MGGMAFGVSRKRPAASHGAAAPPLRGRRRARARLQKLGLEPAIPRALAMFDQLTARLTEAIQRVSGRGRITEENVRDTMRTIRMALLEADVAVPVAKALVDRVRDRALGEEVARSLNPGQAFVKIVHDELIAVLGGDASPLNPRGSPAVLMLVGLQGAGKTTTA